MNRDPLVIRQAFFDERERTPGARARELAATLGVPEGALVASCCRATDGPLQSVRLRDDFKALLAQMPSLGLVKAITRNEQVVIEIEGAYGNVEFFGAMGQSVCDVDLRIFASRWKHGFFVTEPTRRGPRRSLQFFDAQGTAIHKDYILEQTDAAALAALLDAFRAPDQQPAASFEAPAVAPDERPDEQIDAAGLRDAWRAMQDTHEHFGLLRRFGVTRTQALRLAGSEFATPIDRQSLEPLLREAAQIELPFMIFVGNAGVIQIYSGPVRRVVPMDGWLNVLDPAFNLHARADGAAEAWVVRKPTADGIVTAVEFYDQAGEQIALCSGKRKPGQAEMPAWRELTASLVG